MSEEDNDSDHSHDNEDGESGADMMFSASSGVRLTGQVLLNSSAVNSNTNQT